MIYRIEWLLRAGTTLKDVELIINAFRFIVIKLVKD